MGKLYKMHVMEVGNEISEDDMYFPDHFAKAMLAKNGAKIVVGKVRGGFFRHIREIEDKDAE